MYKPYRVVHIKESKDKNLTAQISLASSLDLFQSLNFNTKNHPKNSLKEGQFLVGQDPSFVTSKKIRIENKIRSLTVKTPTSKESTEKEHPHKIRKSMKITAGSETLNENINETKIIRRCQTALKRFDHTNSVKSKVTMKELDEEYKFSCSVDLKNHSRMVEPIFDNNDFIHKRGPYSHQLGQSDLERTTYSFKTNNNYKNEKKKGNTFSEYYSKQIRKKSESDKLKSKEVEFRTPMKIISLEKKKHTILIQHQDAEEVFCPWEKSLDIKIAGISINSLKVPNEDKNMVILFESKCGKKNNFSRFKEKAKKEQNITGWANEEDDVDENS